MKAKRTLHKKHIEMHHQKMDLLKKENDKKNNEDEEHVKLPESNTDDINDAFHDIVVPKKRKMDKLYKVKAKKQKVEKDENYIPYAPADRHTEEG